jgi:glucose/arabinose dehydrogenase
MRAFIALMALMVAGCASQSSHPQANPTTAAPAVPAANATASATNGAAPAANAAVPAVTAAVPAAPVAPGSIEAQRLAKAKNLNLKIFNKDGKELFCRSNYFTGSRIQRDQRCYTAEQLDLMDRAVQREFEQFLQAPNSQNPAMYPGK